MFTYEEIFNNKKTILFVAAHPDDVDVLSGGLIARLVHEQKNVFVLLTTKGARGSQQNHVSEVELATIREAEQTRALGILGIMPSNLFTLDYKDGEVDSNYKLIGEIVKVIRKTKPEIVVSFDPDIIYFKFEQLGKYMVQHRDHRNTGISTMDAVYPFSRDRSFFPDHFQENIEPHYVKEMLLWTADQNADATIDITGFEDKKKLAMLEHKSQFNLETVERIMQMRQNGGKYYEKAKYIYLN